MAVDSDPERELLELRSKQLFGQIHRLRLMIAFAEAAGRRINPTELSWDLRVTQSAIQRPLKDLEDAGLITREVEGRKSFYVAKKSKYWEATLETRDEVRDELERRALREIS